VGYLPERPRLPRYLTDRQVIQYYAALSKVPSRLGRQRSSELLQAVGMTQYADRKVAGYSKGMVQRIGLAQALVNDPDLVILDEPAGGLDPLGRRHVRQLLVALREQGKTVLLNSHLLSEIERVCDRVAILVEGRIIRQGRLGEMTRGKQFYQIETHRADPSAVREALAAELAGQDRIQIDRQRVRIASGDPADAQPIIDALRRGGVVIRSVQPVGQSLEDLFVEAVAEPADRPPEPPSGGAR